MNFKIANLIDTHRKYVERLTIEAVERNAELYCRRQPSRIVQMSVVEATKIRLIASHDYADHLATRSFMWLFSLSIPLSLAIYIAELFHPKPLVLIGGLLGFIVFNLGHLVILSYYADRLTQELSGIYDAMQIQNKFQSVSQYKDYVARLYELAVTPFTKKLEIEVKLHDR